VARRCFFSPQGTSPPDFFFLVVTQAPTSFGFVPCSNREPVCSPFPFVSNPFGVSDCVLSVFLILLLFYFLTTANANRFNLSAPFFFNPPSAFVDSPPRGPFFPRIKPQLRPTHPSHFLTHFLKFFIRSVNFSRHLDPPPPPKVIRTHLFFFT